VLEGELSLSLHPEKTRIVSADDGFEFLGFHYFRDPKTGRQCQEVRQKSVARFREAIRGRTPRLHAQRAVRRKHVTIRRLKRNQRVQAMLKRVNAFTRGWYWYFKSARSRYTPAFNTFDGFIRRRLRSAIIGRSSTHGWHRQPTNAFMRAIGYVSLCDLDIRYHQGQLASPARKG